MKCAGNEWLYNFRKKHVELSLRRYEGCSLLRATSFNRHNMKFFYAKLKEVMTRKPTFANGSAYNIDETDTTVYKYYRKILQLKTKSKCVK